MLRLKDLPEGMDLRGTYGYDGGMRKNVNLFVGLTLLGVGLGIATTQPWTLVAGIACACLGASSGAFLGSWLHGQGLCPCAFRRAKRIECQAVRAAQDQSVADWHEHNHK